MADRTDKVSFTFTRYDTDRLWPLTKILGKWRKLPFGYRKLGPGRFAIDTVQGYSLILEFWFVR